MNKIKEATATTRAFFFGEWTATERVLFVVDVFLLGVICGMLFAPKCGKSKEKYIVVEKEAKAE